MTRPALLALTLALAGCSQEPQYCPVPEKQVEALNIDQGGTGLSPTECFLGNGDWELKWKAEADGNCRNRYSVTDRDPEEKVATTHWHGLTENELYYRAAQVMSEGGKWTCYRFDPPIPRFGPEREYRDDEIVPCPADIAG